MSSTSSFGKTCYNCKNACKGNKCFNTTIKENNEYIIITVCCTKCMEKISFKKRGSNSKKRTRHGPKERGKNKYN